MFGKLMAWLFGKEMYGEIVNIEDTLSIDVRSALPQKKITVIYCIHGEDYFVSRELMDVLSKHNKELWIGNTIRILVDPMNPRHLISMNLTIQNTTYEKYIL